MVLRDPSVRNFLAGGQANDKVDYAVGLSGGTLRDLTDLADLGYVVVHPPYSQEAVIIEYLEENLSLEKFYARDGVVAYKIVQ